MAMVSQCSGRYDKALEYYRTSLLIQRKSRHGNAGLAAIKALDSMACIYANLGQFHESVPLLQESLAAKHRMVSDEPIYLGECELDLAVQLKTIGRCSEAYRLCSEAHKVFVEKLGASNQRTKQAAVLLSELANSEISVASESFHLLSGSLDGDMSNIQPGILSDPAHSL
jgi:tetratricopeptide (TPR) repeat protein